MGGNVEMFYVDSIKYDVACVEHVITFQPTLPFEMPLVLVLRVLLGT